MAVDVGVRVGVGAAELDGGVAVDAVDAVVVEEAGRVGVAVGAGCT